MLTTMASPRIIFAGTPEFAVASLEALVESGFVPCLVLTQPDRRAGRGKRLTMSPVKEYAIRQQIEVRQPVSLRDEAVVEELANLEPDIMVVAAYGLLLPQNVLDIPRAGCLNVHASMLPRWRGAAPIQAAILAGDTESGACLMAMEAGLDTGPVYVSQRVQIGKHETAGELHDRLAAAGAEILASNIGAIIDGELDAAPQDDERASYAPKIKSSDAELDWNRPATDLERLVRAYNPVPGAWFMMDDQRIKVWRARCIASVDAPPGTVVAVERDGIVISCHDGALQLESLQRPGKRAVSAAEFAAQFDLPGRKL
jgi:methionyl-tRNA formyltransferase